MVTRFSSQKFHVALRDWRPNTPKEWTGFGVSIAIVLLSVLVVLLRLGDHGAFAADGVLNISPQEWMSVLYLPLAGVLAMNAVLTLIYWYKARRLSMVFMAAMMHASDSVITLILSATTGENPHFDIAEMRTLLVISRFSLFIFGILCAISAIKLLVRYDKHVTVVEVPKFSADAPREAEMCAQDKK